MTAKNLAIIVLISLSLTACRHQTAYMDFQSVPMDGWAADSILTFTVPIQNVNSRYDILLHVRHTDAYSYQNMWLFIGEKRQDKDTIEFFLADDRGRWLGNGHSLLDMPVLYKNNVQFTDSIYVLTIQQGMREEALKGISDIGVEIVKHGQE